MKVLVTGATGFVGSALMSALVTEPHIEARGAARSGSEQDRATAPIYGVGNIDAKTNWQPCLEGVDAVVHLAARAHVLQESCKDPLSVFREVNVQGTINLAKQCIEAGVKRFVFVSSIGVNGNTTERPFTEFCEPKPHADYAISKFEAEQQLTALLENASMELVIVRPPLVYDAAAPGNFRRLLAFVSKGLPLPFGMLENKRSMVSRTNLVDILKLCLTHPAAANEVFLAGDGEDFSTSEIVTLLAKGMGKSATLIPVPLFVLRTASTLLGRRGMYVQLCESLQVDSSKIRQLLGWKPKTNAQTQLIKAGREYLDSRR